MPQRIEVGVLGATGMVGQQLVTLLANHPWFRVAWLAASQRSTAQRYGDLPWRLPHPIPQEIADLRVESAESAGAPKLVFSALDASVAGGIEAAFARAGRFVVSNAGNHRMDPLVPLLVPEINPDHLNLIPLQRKAYGWPGAIVTNPNCSTVFLALALAALRRFEPRRVLVTTLQALSGAGYPGVAALDALGNVVPFISGEEEKIESETRKILGSFNGSAIEPHPVRISSQCTRVPVVHGHTELVSASFAKAPSEDLIAEAFASFQGPPQKLALPSAPDHPLIHHLGSDRPQPKLDVETNGGMSVHVGRLRRCEVLDYKFVLLGHNTIRGAAGAAILNAELLAAEGWIGLSAAAATAAS